MGNEYLILNSAMAVLSELICLDHGWLRGSNIGTCSEKIAVAPKPLPSCLEGSKTGGDANPCLTTPILELICGRGGLNHYLQLRNNLLGFVYRTWVSMVTMHGK